MELQVNKARVRVGESFPFSWDVPLSSEQYAGRTLQFAAPAHVEGTYLFDGKAFFVEAPAKIARQSVCVRCLEPFVEALTFPIHERFSRDGGDDDGESYRLEGDMLSLDAAFWDNMFLQLPLVSVCSEDCKGLCPVCGINKNREQCTCSDASASSPFSVLKGLHQENEEV